jgi:hypothetical protein
MSGTGDVDTQASMASSTHSWTLQNTDSTGGSSFGHYRYNSAASRYMFGQDPVTNVGYIFTDAAWANGWRLYMTDWYNPALSVTHEKYVGVNTVTPLAQFEVKSGTTGINYVLRVSSQNGAAMSGVTADGRYNLRGSTYTLPSGYGTAGQVWTTDGAGIVTWGTVTSTITGGSGGSSTLATATGTSSGFNGTVSSPTPVFLLNNVQFIGSVQGGGTAYFRLDPSTVSLLGPSIDLASLEITGLLASTGIANGQLNNGVRVTTSSILANGVATSTTVLYGNGLWNAITGDNMGNNKSTGPLDMSNFAVNSASAINLSGTGNGVIASTNPIEFRTGVAISSFTLSTGGWTMPDVTAPAVAPSGYVRFYSKSGNLYQQDSSGVETNLASGGGTGMQNPATSTFNMNGFGIINLASASFNQAEQPVLYSSQPSFALAVVTTATPQYNFYGSSFAFASTGTIAALNITQPLATASGGTGISTLPVEEIMIPALLIKGASVNGAVAASSATATNAVNTDYLAFIPSTTKYAYWDRDLPTSFDGSTVTFKVVWTSTGGLTTSTVSWCLQAVALADSDALETAYGSAVCISDSYISSNTVRVSPESAAVTIGNTYSQDDHITWRIYRDGASATMNDEARLLEVRVRYRRKGYSD